MRSDCALPTEAKTSPRTTRAATSVVMTATIAVAVASRSRATLLGCRMPGGTCGWRAELVVAARAARAETAIQNADIAAGADTILNRAAATGTPDSDTARAVLNQPKCRRRHTLTSSAAVRTAARMTSSRVGPANESYRSVAEVR